MEGPATDGALGLGRDPARRGADLVALLVDSVTDYAIFALDVDGRVSTWNRGAAALKGYRADEIIGEHFSAFYSDEDRADGKPDRELAIAAAAGSFEDEGWRIRQDGSQFWANVVITALRGPDGRLVGFGKVTRDLTERKRGEDALRDSEERFRLLVGGVLDYAIFLLEPDGTVASWNLGAERLKGYRADEIIGRHLSTFYTEEDRRRGVPQAGLATALEEGRWESAGWRVRKDGTRFWADIVVTPLRGNDGTLKGFAKITRDLTDRKRNEDALHGILARERDAAEQLRELDRMRRELVTVVAHDLRGPVSVIENLLFLLRADWHELADADRIEMVDRARSRTTALGDLVDDVFDIALIDAGRLEVASGPIDITAAAQAVVDDARTTSTRSITSRIEPDLEAQGDARRVTQILANLVANALKFSPEETPVSIEAHRDGDGIAVVVTDAGPGIPVTEQERIFDRFARLPHHDGTPGTGMGLFIARSLAEAQGGSLTLVSSPGKGAEFRLSLAATTGVGG